MQDNRITPTVVFSILFIISAAHSQIEAPIHPLDKEYIKDWLILGPFFPDSLGRDFLSTAGGEEEIKPKEGDTVVTAEGDTLTWKRYTSKQQIVDLLKSIGDYQNATAYAFCLLENEIQRQNDFLLGSDDGVAVWINGKRVNYKDVSRQIFLDQDKFTGDLNKGINRCLVKVSQGTGKWGFALRLLPIDQPINATPAFFLSSEDLKNEIYLYSIPWKYKSGDNTNWAQSDIDDSSWESIYPTLSETDFPKDRWQGIGWFRLHIAIDSTMIGKPLGLSLQQAGTSQIYLDGKLIYKFGGHLDGRTGLPRILTFEGKTRHVIAIRYSNSAMSKFHNAGYAGGFFLRLGNINQMTDELVQREKTYTGLQIFFTTLSLAIGLLHLILFAFFPRLKQNLYFAFFLFSYAATIFFDYQILLSSNSADQLFAFRLHCVMIPFWLVFQLRFVYSIFYVKLPKQFWIVSLIAFVLGTIVSYSPQNNFGLFAFLYGMIYAEIIRVISFAIYEKKEGGWILGLAFFVFFLFGLLDNLMDRGIFMSLREIENPYAFGSVSFFIAMSIYLSRDFARTNKKIAEQEVEKTLLEVENVRQSKELEEARQLQLSMLPKEVPQHPHLEIAAYMKTATEVGGDYYDFKSHEDGTLTLVIGDATGHGMQAGTMVSATKSLFYALADEPETLIFLSKASKAIKEMNLKKMYMALTIARFKDDHLQIAAAGMPFPLIYRSATGIIEEIELKGMPLGSVASFPYKDKNLSLNKNDTILLMSDGLEEMFNPQNEILGSDRVKIVFDNSAQKSAEEIINQLINAGESWADGRDQEDDVTFVVIKIKE
jgi:serine phosphatase RsbU (regulator of sigma subunit)